MEPDFAKGGGLLPVVAQDAITGDVLMLAYMDAEALAQTKATGFMHYHSRSRGALWKKGESSGNLQEVVALELDCDGDAILAKVRQTGPACHTGSASCFHTRHHGTGDVLLTELRQVFAARKANPDPKSHTTRLLTDENLRLKKIVEEAGEVLMAAKDHDKAELTGELADLLFHALVVAEVEGITPRDVLEVLAARRHAPRRG